MKMKRVLSMALALCMVFGSAAALPEGTFITQSTSITATAESVEQTEEDFTYQLSSDGTFALVTGFKKPSETTCTIPETLGGVPVEVIAQEAFKDKTNLQSVTFPSKLRNIAVSAFEGCTKLERVTIPNSVTTIGDKAFDQACTIRCKSGSKAQSYAVLNGNPIEYISGDFVFKQLKNNKVEIVEYSGEDTNLTIPSEWSNNTVTSIAAGVFKDCTDLKRVTIPRSVEDIGNNAFDKSCTIIGYASSEAIYYAGGHGNKVEYISGNFVYKVLSDNTVEITEYHGEDAALTIPAAWGDYPVSTIGMRVFENNAKLTSVTISDSVTTIKDNAFVGCANLASAIVPKTVTKIGNYAFGYVFDESSLPVVNPNFTLNCYNDTAAEKYVKDNKLKGKLLDVEHVAAVAATCTKAGNIEYWTCGDKFYSDAVADTEITQEKTVVKAKGHSFPDKWTVTKQATCTTPGSEQRVCTVCAGKEEGGTETREIKAKGHTKASTWTIVKPASVATAGKKILTCTVCKETLQTEQITKLTKDRANGINRFETAQKIATKVKEENSNAAFQSIIIASGADFADALSASYLAKVKGAPILLVANKASAVLKSTVDYVKNNAVSKATVYIIGGDAVVPDSLASDLKKAGYTVKRIAGKNRYDTNIEVLKEAGVTKEQILIASGSDYADALSASAVGKPILLVAGKTSSLTPNQKTYLNSLKSKDSSALSQAYIIGGTGAVSAGIEKQVKSLFTKSTRVNGNNRYETSVAVAKKFFKNPKTVALAYGLNYPDGLCGGPLALAYNCPLLLTINSRTEAAAAYVKSVKADSAIALGGPSLISDSAIKAILGK